MSGNCLSDSAHETAVLCTNQETPELHGFHGDVFSSRKTFVNALLVFARALLVLANDFLVFASALLVKGSGEQLKNVFAGAIGACWSGPLRGLEEGPSAA